VEPFERELGVAGEHGAVTRRGFEVGKPTRDVRRFVASGVLLDYSDFHSSQRLKKKARRARRTRRKSLDRDERRSTTLRMGVHTELFVGQDLIFSFVFFAVFVPSFTTRQF
jgi:hypothetical protein